MQKAYEGLLLTPCCVCGLSGATALSQQAAGRSHEGMHHSFSYVCFLYFYIDLCRAVNPRRFVRRFSTVALLATPYIMEQDFAIDKIFELAN